MQIFFIEKMYSLDLLCKQLQSANAKMKFHVARGSDIISFENAKIELSRGFSQLFCTTKI
jgi:hypothetical protein